MVEKPLRKRSLRRPRRWIFSIKVDLKKPGYGDGNG
jgi:hypothetical protein